MCDIILQVTIMFFKISKINFFMYKYNTGKIYSFEKLDCQLVMKHLYLLIT
jgi:hypothetical protein